MFKDFIIIFGCASIMFVLLLSMMFTISGFRCDEIGVTSERATEYRWLSGCYVETSEGFIPIENWRVNIDGE